VTPDRPAFDDSGALVPSVPFDYGEVEPSPEDDVRVMVFARLIDSMVRPPWKPMILARRTIALGLVLGHPHVCRFTLTEWAARLDCTPAALSKIAGQLSREFNVTPRWRKIRKLKAPRQRANEKAVFQKTG
jgi:hypothetical protein